MIEVKEFEAGDIIFREGDPAHQAFIIEEGKVEVYKDKHGESARISELIPNDIIGELALFDDEPRSASVVALEKTRCSIISEDVFQEQLSKLDPHFRAIINSIVLRLRNTTDSEALIFAITGLTEKAMTIKDEDKAVV